MFGFPVAERWTAPAPQPAAGSGEAALPQEQLQPRGAFPQSVADNNDDTANPVVLQGIPVSGFGQHGGGRPILIATGNITGGADTGGLGLGGHNVVFIGAPGPGMQAIIAPRPAPMLTMDETEACEEAIIVCSRLRIYLAVSLIFAAINAFSFYYVAIALLPGIVAFVGARKYHVNLLLGGISFWAALFALRVTALVMMHQSAADPPPLMWAITIFAILVMIVEAYFLYTHVRLVRLIWNFNETQLRLAEEQPPVCGCL